jgi:hypothetical protein
MSNGKRRDPMRTHPTMNTMAKMIASGSMLLPEVLALSKAAKTVGSALAIDVVAAAVPAGATKPLGSLPPLGAAPLTARPRTTPRLATGSGGSGWTQAAAHTANAFSDSAYRTYTVDVPRSINALQRIDTTGMTGEERYAAAQEGAVWVRLAKKSINKHVAFMRNHPAATCFRDAYAADQEVAANYLKVLSGCP